MRYTIWRLSPDSDPILMSTTGSTSVKEWALEKVRVYNQRLAHSDPQSSDRFAVLDEKGRELKQAS